jgi:hypothetical protein
MLLASQEFINQPEKDPDDSVDSNMLHKGRRQSAQICRFIPCTTEHKQRMSMKEKIHERMS